MKTLSAVIGLLGWFGTINPMLAQAVISEVTAGGPNGQVSVNIPHVLPPPKLNVSFSTQSQNTVTTGWGEAAFLGFSATPGSYTKLSIVRSGTDVYGIPLATIDEEYTFDPVTGTSTFNQQYSIFRYEVLLEYASYLVEFAFNGPVSAISLTDDNLSWTIQHTGLIDGVTPEQGWTSTSITLSGLLPTYKVVTSPASDFTPTTPQASLVLQGDGTNGFYNVTTSQYRLHVPDGATGTVYWMVVFTPSENSAPKYWFYSWPVNGTDSPYYTIDPRALNPNQAGTYQVVRINPDISVDANRDGQIQLSSEDSTDATSATKPFRFWLNDDDDTEGTLMADGSNGPPFDEAEKTPVTTADYTRHKIGSKRNLEDFARLWMDLSGLQSMVTTSGGIQVGLKWKSVTGTPAVILYVSADAAGSDGYLKIYQDFPNQLTMPAYNNAITFANSQQTVNTSGTFVFPLALLQTELQRGPVLHLLFEGAGVGTGQLIIVLLDKDGNPIGEGPGVWLDLKNIKTMYEQYRATPATLPRPFDSTTGPYDSGQVSFEAYPGRPTFQKPVDEEQKLLVFVNGSNETYAYSTSVAETLFKRLWWQGYKGRLVSFRWETLVGPFTGEIPAHYNLNEWLAWNWGKGLKDYLISSSAPSGYTVNVAAHSLGNIVVASALRLGMQASNVVLLQGAIPAGCFDTSGEINGFEDMLNKETNRPTPDFAAALGYRGFVTNAGGATIHNFFNVQDYALSTGPLDAWEGNQELNKPDPLDVLTSIVPNMAYDYDATTSGLAVTQRGRLFNTQSFSVARFVATPYESMSFIARSRSKALGAKENIKGVITHEVAIGPNTPTNLQNQRSDHSGEFTRPIQQLDAFYKEFIKDIGAAPIQ